MNATETEKTVTTCRVCNARITQREADEGAEIVGPGHETMCPACAQSIKDAPSETATKSINLNVTEIVAKCLFSAFRICLRDDDASNIEHNSVFSGLYGIEPDNSGCIALPLHETDDGMEKCTAFLEESQYVKSYEEIKIFADVNNDLPAEISAKFHEKMSKRFDQLVGAYDPHYIADEHDVLECLAESVSEWILS